MRPLKYQQRANLIAKDSRARQPHITCVFGDKIIEAKPLCTVAIPAYNRPEAVCRALESALAQDLPALQVLVVDDCSTDGAWEAVQRYTDPRLRLVRNERNLGLFANFNRCLELAEGKYVRLLCNDDRLVPGCLRHETDLMEQHSNVTLVSTYTWVVDSEDKRISKMGDDLLPGIYRGDEVVAEALRVLSHHARSLFSFPSGVLMRQDAIQKAGTFDTNLNHIGDVDYFLKVLQHGDLAITDNFGCEVMNHPGSTTSSLFANGHFTEEWFTLAQRWSSHLPSRRAYRQIMEQSAAFSIYWAQLFWRQGQREVARRYWRAAQQGDLSVRGWMTAITRALSIYLALRSSRPQVPSTQPIQPYQSLA